MMSRIYCTNPQHGELHFYLLHRGKPYYLFCQPYRRQVYQFYARPMLLDDALSYAIKCEGKDIGSIRNGYWVWTPEKGGNYDVDFIASNADGKSATTYVTFRVAGDATPEPEPSESGCKSAVSASAGIVGGALILAGAVFALIGRKRER